MMIACRPVVALPKGGPETVPGTEIWVSFGAVIGGFGDSRAILGAGPGPIVWLKQQLQTPRAPSLTGAAARSLEELSTSKVLQEPFGWAPHALQRLIPSATNVSPKDVDADNKEMWNS